MQFVAYYRVSTRTQGTSGLGLEAQRDSVSQYIHAKSSQLLAEFQEIESGATDERPELTAAMRLCKQRKAVLLIAKLDRLSRNVGTIANLMNSDVPFVAVDMPEADRFTLHIMAAVAERERQMISERTTAALKVAKARGVVLGNPKIGEARAKAAISKSAIAQRFALTLEAQLEPMRRAQYSLKQMADHLNERRIPAARGGSWYPQTVKNVIRILKARVV